MILEINKSKRYGFKNCLFINKRIYTAVSKIGNFIDDEGYMGPVSCGSVALNKSEAMIKAFSESIERRATTIGAKDRGNEKALTFDLINKTVSSINQNLTRINMNPYIDTTGSASHVDSSIAVFKAISELLEKNAVLLFWYGKKAYKLKFQVSSVYLDRLCSFDSTVNLYVQDSFLPLLVVICVAKNRRHDLEYRFGVGSDFDLNMAIEKSLAEAFFLGQYYELVFQNKEIVGEAYEDSVIHLQKDPEVLEYLESFPDLKTFDLDNNLTPQIEPSMKIDYLISRLPVWITDLHISVLQQVVFPRLITVKAFSHDLISHVPQKTLININTTICKQGLRLSESDLIKIPDCPII